jgi:long-subunit fatty acid transport protein
MSGYRTALSPNDSTGRFMTDTVPVSVIPRPGRGIRRESKKHGYRVRCGMTTIHHKRILRIFTIHSIKALSMAGLILFFCLLLVTGASAQVENSSSLNPVGSGARATGMGGAFIGVADDATAASWNPAGLIQLERPEISAVYSFFQRKQTYESEKFPEMEGENSMHSDGLNYASIAYPFVLMNRNMIVSLNYQRLYEMNKDTFFRRFVDVGIGVLTQDTNFTQDGFLYALSPALAVQVTPYFSLGATLNISFPESNDMTLKMPASYGLGLAYRHSDSLTIAFDIYRTEWSRYVQVDRHGAETNPFDGQSIHDGRLVDTTQVRMGMEYLFIKEKYVVPVRFGIFYDPEPQKGHVDEYYGFSAGTGYSRGRVALDCAYQFRMGRNLTGDVPAAISQDVDIDVKQHVFMISSIFYF